jgi:signal transduction histidine kinase
MKATLLLALVITVGLWIGAGYYFMHRINETETRTAAVQARYMQAQDQLSTVRAQILLGSVLVRDALLDPDADLESYRRELDVTYRALDESLALYVPVLDTPPQRERLANLRAQITDFRQSTLRVMAEGKGRDPRQALGLLRTVVVPKRELVISVSEEVQALNRTAYFQQQDEVAAIYTDSQRRLWQSLGAALAISLAIGLIAAGRAGRLESVLRRQKDVEARAARELQDLSAKLMTVQEDERRSIARELHDEVGQLLAAVKVELSLAQQAVDTGAAGTAVLAGARTMTDTAIVSVRDLSRLLHPAVLDDLGLSAAVDWYLREFGGRYRLRTSLNRFGPDDRLAPDIEAAAYRIIQEALTNIAKHARATSCYVTIDRQADRLLLRIDDDGVGFSSVPLTEPTGLGLIGMRERATGVGGTVQYLSAPGGGGARVSVDLPARPRRAAPAAATVSPSPAPLGDPMVADG